jgi:hypothetical protein
LIKQGQVRKLYDIATGKRIKSLADVYNNQNIALSSFDPFKKRNYKVIDFSDKSVKKSAETLRIVRFYPNGDVYHMGLSVTLSKRKFPVLQKLLDFLNVHIELVSGKIQKIYNIEGKRILNIAELEADNILVANDDPFIKAEYNIKAVKPSVDKPGLRGATFQNEMLDHIRPITKGRAPSRATTSGTFNRLRTARSRNEKTKPRAVLVEEPTESVPETPAQQPQKQPKLKVAKVIRKPAPNQILKAPGTAGISNSKPYNKENNPNHEPLELDASESETKSEGIFILN